MKAHNFQKKTMRLIQQCAAIIDDYASRGYSLSLRQLYYQLVSGNIIPNKQTEYTKLSSTLTDARKAHLIPFDALEDRGRVPRIPADWDSIDSLLDSAIRQFRLPRWKGQAHYVEVWTEKDALSGVLGDIAREFHVPLIVNKGFTSCSAMHENAQRILEAQRQGRECTVLYIGDLDPSGVDMVRDIANRLKTDGGVDDLAMHKVGLTMEQARRYQLPPNPVKMTDTRAAGYVEKYATTDCWEVDALPVDVLVSLVREEIVARLDAGLMQDVMRQESAIKGKARSALVEAGVLQ